MALCAAHPELIAGVVMNDVGPVLDPEGLLRIRSYVGKLPTPQTMQEGAQILQRMSGEQFPGFHGRTMVEDGPGDMARDR